MWIRREAHRLGRPALRTLLADVPQALLEQIEHVLVVERVVDAAAFAAPLDDAHRAHQAQLMRDGGFAEPDVFGDFVDAELPARQGVDDADAGGIAEDTERFRERLDGRGVDREGASRYLHI